MDAGLQYEVEKIVSHRYNRALRRHEYRLRYSHYDNTDDTWELASSLYGPAFGLLEQYLAKRGLSRPPDGGDSEPSPPAATPTTAPTDTGPSGASSASEPDPGEARAARRDRRAADRDERLSASQPLRAGSRLAARALAPPAAVCLPSQLPCLAGAWHRLALGVTSSTSPRWDAARRGRFGRTLGLAIASLAIEIRIMGRRRLRRTAHIFMLPHMIPWCVPVLRRSPRVAIRRVPSPSSSFPLPWALSHRTNPRRCAPPPWGSSSRRPLFFLSPGLPPRLCLSWSPPPPHHRIMRAARPSAIPPRRRAVSPAASFLVVASFSRPHVLLLSPSTPATLAEAPSLAGCVLARPETFPGSLRRFVPWRSGRRPYPSFSLILRPRGAVAPAPLAHRLHLFPLTFLHPPVVDSLLRLGRRGPCAVPAGGRRPSARSGRCAPTSRATGPRCCLLPRCRICGGW
jgi:hypothetical protein